MFISWLSHIITYQNPKKSTANRTMILIHWQGSLVRELWLVVQYFLASSLSLPHGRLSVIVMGYISKVTLMRINQVLTSLHLQNMAWWLCTFAKYLGDCDNEFSMGEYSLVCVCMVSCGLSAVIVGYCIMICFYGSLGNLTEWLPIVTVIQSTSLFASVN